MVDHFTREHEITGIPVWSEFLNGPGSSFALNWPVVSLLIYEILCRIWWSNKYDLHELSVIRVFMAIRQELLRNLCPWNLRYQPDLVSSLIILSKRLRLTRRLILWFRSGHRSLSVVSWFSRLVDNYRGNRTFS